MSHLRKSGVENPGALPTKKKFLGTFRYESKTTQEPCYSFLMVSKQKFGMGRAGNGTLVTLTGMSHEGQECIRAQSQR